MEKRIKETVYALVRDDADGEPWVDLGTVAHHPAKARQAQREALESAAFQERNKVLRVASFVLEETF